MKRVIIESPYSGGVETHETYLARCIEDSLERGEAPFASHGFYTRYLDDSREEDRETGMRAGWTWLEMADLVVMYEDYGISDGMQEGSRIAISEGVPVEYRSIGRNPEPAEYVVPKKTVVLTREQVESLATGVGGFITANDPVSPSHYKFPNGAEVIQISQHLTSLGGQALQYIARATRLDGQNKGNSVEDLRKAIFFLNAEIERLSS